MKIASSVVSCVLVLTALIAVHAMSEVEAAGDPIFEDGFETGSTANWSDVSGDTIFKIQTGRIAEDSQVSLTGVVLTSGFTWSDDSQAGSTQRI